MNYSVKSNLFNSWASTYEKDFSQNHLSHLALDISYISNWKSLNDLFHLLHNMVNRWTYGHIFLG